MVAAALIWIGLSLGLAEAASAESLEDALERGRMAGDRAQVEEAERARRAAAASVAGKAPDSASSAPSACAPPPEKAVIVDPGGTYLRASIVRNGKPVFIHVTEDDMPWVVAIGKPNRAPRYGSRADARRVAIEAMQEWERAIQPQVPWFRLEFVEEDDGAAVQVKWKRRITGPWSGFGKQRWWTENGCLRVGGEMEVSTEPGTYSHLKLEEVKLLIAHEFGHVLGLGHCLNCESAMNYAWHTRERIFVTDLDVRTFVKLISIPNGAVGIGAPPPESDPDS